MWFRFGIYTYTCRLWMIRWILWTVVLLSIILHVYLGLIVMWLLPRLLSLQVSCVPYTLPTEHPVGYLTTSLRPAEWQPPRPTPPISRGSSPLSGWTPSVDHAHLTLPACRWCWTGGSLGRWRLTKLRSWQQKSGLSKHRDRRKYDRGINSQAQSSYTWY